MAVNRQGCSLCLSDRDRINERSNLPSPQQQDVIFRLMFEYERNQDYQEIPEERRSVDFGGYQFQHGSSMVSTFTSVCFIRPRDYLNAISRKHTSGAAYQ